MFLSVVFNKAHSLLTVRRVFVHAITLAVLTNTMWIAFYIHVPSFFESPGADFVQFYSVALLARDNSDKIYDVKAGKETQQRFSPRGRRTTYVPYIHAPFFTVLLIPLSFFSYVEAYWVWAVFTLVLYGLSIAVISRLDPTRGPPLKLALAVAYAAPVFYWLILTGQTTAIAFLLWTFAFVLMKQSQIFWAAFVLGFLSYRAQYLTVILPLMVICRMRLGILGIAASCLLLAVLGGLVFSFDTYWAYVDTVLSQSRRIVTLQQSLSHYVTLYGFFRPHMSHYGAVVCTMASALPLIWWLLKSWLTFHPSQSKALDLQWALLITTTLLLMHHGFVYDLLLLNLSILLLYPYRSLLAPYYKFLLIFLYFVPYIFLVFPGKISINPIQPILYWLCFEIYRVYKVVRAQDTDLPSRRDPPGLSK